MSFNNQKTIEIQNEFDIGNKKNNIVFCVFEVLIVLMPLHEYICVLMVDNTKIDNLWRDLLIIGAVFLAMINFNFSIKNNIVEKCIVINVGVLCIFACCSFVLFRYPSTFNILRTYIMPMLVVFIIKGSVASYDRWKRLLRILFLEFALMGYYCFVQAFILGTPFALKLGYGQDGRLGYQFYISGFYGRLRAFGTFVYPNICGIILSMFLCLYLFSKIRKEDRTIKQIFIMGGMSIGLLSTFSRSAILGTVVAVIYYCIFVKKISFSQKTVTYIALVSVSCLLLFVVVDRFMLNGTFSEMIFSYINRTISGQDTSAPKHIEDLYSPIPTVIMNPLGLGFGSNGSIALATTANTNLVESSFWLMCYEIGPIFAMLFFVPYFNLIFNKRYRTEKKYSSCVCAIISVCTTFLLLPNIQSYEVLFYTFTIIGLAQKKELETIL